MQFNYLFLTPNKFKFSNKKKLKIINLKTLVLLFMK